MFEIDLSGQLALVTGASRGIGATIADTLGAAGATVVGTATSPAGAEGITARLEEGGKTGRGAVLDVTDADAIKALVDEVSKRDGAPGILVNNAGITRDNLLLRMKPDEWDDVITANLTGVFHLCKACLRGMMKARRGRVINITSVVGVTGNPGQANYAAAKAGMIGFSKSLAQEVGSRNITVNTIAPGFIDTDMTRALEPAQRETLTTRIPLQRLGEASDVAAAVLYLASDMAAYVTGETLHVNGGMYMP